jgi:hypothetical protein
MTNAGMTAYQLVDALRRAGWGILRGSENRCARTLLETLAGTMRALKTDTRGYMTITASQLADRAGYSERHVRRWLPILEDLGILSWSRGWIEEGKPQPGSMKINKAALVDYVQDARIQYDEAVLPLRAAKTAARLAKLRLLRIKPYHRRGKGRADTASSLSSYERATARSGSRSLSLSIPPTNKSNAVSVAAVSEAKPMTIMITYQAYMQKKYPGTPSARWIELVDLDPVAEELAVCGALSYEDLRSLEADMRAEHVNLTGVGTRL